MCGKIDISKNFIVWKLIFIYCCNFIVSIFSMRTKKNSLTRFVSVVCNVLLMFVVDRVSLSTRLSCKGYHE